MFLERISQVLSDYDVVIVCYYGIESIRDSLYTYLCSSKCVLKFVQFTFAGEAIVHLLLYCYYYYTVIIILLLLLYCYYYTVIIIL